MIFQKQFFQCYSGMNVDSNYIKIEWLVTKIHGLLSMINDATAGSAWLEKSNCDYSTSFPALYATELKADFYLQLNAEPQRIKKMVPYFVGSHKKCPPG